MKKKLISQSIFIIAVFSFLLAPLLSQTNQAQRKIMARRAAIVDAQRVLSEIIDGIYIDSKTQVKDFITTDDSIKGELQGFIRTAEVVSEQYKEEIYKVTMSIDVEKLKRILGKDLEYGAPYIEAVGQGAAPTDKKPIPKITVEEPEEHWFEQKIQAKGYGAQPDDSSMSKAQKKLNAERAARMDAYRNLIEQIKGVNVDSRTTIQDFITLDDTIETNIRAFVKGARAIETKHLKDGRAEVTLEINLEPLRAIIE